VAHERQVAEYPEPFLLFVEHFNEQRYRECVEPLEEIWFAQRDDFHKALIRICVGLNQIGLGLDSGPRFLLRTAGELLAPYGGRHQGLDLQELRQFLLEAEGLLDHPPPREVPPFTLRLD
jgi:predicted metal-dependent hydrolase